jgi:hypothetical protein
MRQAQMCLQAQNSASEAEADNMPAKPARLSFFYPLLSLNITMSFGFSVGDFIAAIELANKIRKEFVDAPSQFKAISDERVV